MKRFLLLLAFLMCACVVHGEIEFTAPAGAGGIAGFTPGTIIIGQDDIATTNGLTQPVVVLTNAGTLNSGLPDICWGTNDLGALIYFSCDGGGAASTNGLATTNLVVATSNTLAAATALKLDITATNTLVSTNFAAANNIFTGTNTFTKPLMIDSAESDSQPIVFTDDSSGYTRQMFLRSNHLYLNEPGFPDQVWQLVLDADLAGATNVLASTNDARAITLPAAAVGYATEAGHATNADTAANANALGGIALGGLVQTNRTVVWLNLAVDGAITPGTSTNDMPETTAVFSQLCVQAQGGTLTIPAGYYHVRNADWAGIKNLTVVWEPGAQFWVTNFVTNPKSPRVSWGACIRGESCSNITLIGQSRESGLFSNYRMAEGLHSTGMVAVLFYAATPKTNFDITVQGLTMSNFQHNVCPTDPVVNQRVFRCRILHYGNTNAPVDGSGLQNSGNGGWYEGNYVEGQGNGAFEDWNSAAWPTSRWVMIKNNIFVDGLNGWFPTSEGATPTAREQYSVTGNKFRTTTARVNQAGLGYGLYVSGYRDSEFSGNTFNLDTNAFYTAVYVTSASNVGIHDMQIKTGLRGVWVNGGYKEPLIIRDIFVVRSNAPSGYSFDLTDVTNVSLVSCVATGNIGHVHISQGSNILLDRVTATGAGSGHRGIQLGNEGQWDNLRIENCDLRGNNDALHNYVNTNNYRFINNLIPNIAGFPAYLGNSAFGTYVTSGSVSISNLIVQSVTTGTVTFTVSVDDATNSAGAPIKILRLTP